MQAYRVEKRYHSANPILQQEEISVQRLVTFLNLDTDRVIELLEYDMIEIDMFNQIIVSETRGENYYPMTCTVYHVYPNPNPMENDKLHIIAEFILQNELTLKAAIEKLNLQLQLTIADKRKITVEVNRQLLQSITRNNESLEKEDFPHLVELNKKYRKLLLEY